MWKFIIMISFFQVLVLMIILFRGPEIFGVKSSIGLDPEHWSEETGVHLSIFFDVFVFLQVFNFFNARKLLKDETNVLVDIGDNYLFLFIVVGIVLAQLFIVQFGGKAVMLVPLSVGHHLISILIGSLSLLFGFIVKKCVPDGCLSCIPLFSETEDAGSYDVDSELKKIWLRPASRRRSSKHRI
jgi:magnesium-transporting ATPase (P-type)